ncbi:MAG: hypothetical protein H0X29_10410 [Parachlamydiaceae bacterium]|nr:hypothetical protein [Parachlamydiaceae bacterium]
MTAPTNVKNLFVELTESITPIVEQITNTLDVPLNSLVPEVIWREQTKQKLINYALGIDVKERIDSGFELIVKDIESNLSQVEIDIIKNEFQKGVPKLYEEINHKKSEAVKETNLPITPQMIMSLSDSTIEIFYSSGMRYFNVQSFEPASHVFYVLTILDFYRHNLWLAYGLAEQSCDHIESALQAYARAALTNAESPLPYIYSIECCLKIGEVQQAASYADLALDAFDKNSELNKEFLPRIIQLQQKCK